MLGFYWTQRDIWVKPREIRYLQINTSFFILEFDSHLPVSDTVFCGVDFAIEPLDLWIKCVENGGYILVLG